MIAVLTGINGLDDPALLARLIDGIAGRDLDFRTFGNDFQVRKTRRELLGLAKSMKDTAQHFLRACPTGEHTDKRVEATRALMAGAEATAMDSDSLAAAQRLFDAIALIGQVPLRSDLGTGGRPPVDEAVVRLVHAIAEYCNRKDIPFTGGPRREQADGAAHHFPKSRAARLVADVLARLDIGVQPSELATYMAKARQLADANKLRRTELG